jgi:hypothetical protein
MRQSHYGANGYKTKVTLWESPVCTSPNVMILFAQIRVKGTLSRGPARKGAQGDPNTVELNEHIDQTTEKLLNNLIPQAQNQLLLCKSNVQGPAECVGYSAGLGVACPSDGCSVYY